MLYDVIRTRIRKRIIRPSIVHSVASADFSCEFRFVDVESEIDAERALQIWRALNHLSLSPGSTDIRTHTLQVPCENKRRGKSSGKNRVRGEKRRMDSDKTPAVAECHGERLREVEKKDIIAKHKYICI